MLKMPGSQNGLKEKSYFQDFSFFIHFVTKKLNIFSIPTVSFTILAYNKKYYNFTQCINIHNFVYFFKFLCYTIFVKIGGAVF